MRAAVARSEEAVAALLTSKAGPVGTWSRPRPPGRSCRPRSGSLLGGKLPLLRLELRLSPPRSQSSQAGVPRRMPSPVLEVSGAVRAVQVKAMPLESPGYDRKAEACKVRSDRRAERTALRSSLPSLRISTPASSSDPPPPAVEWRGSDLTRGTLWCCWEGCLNRLIPGPLHPPQCWPRCQLLPGIAPGEVCLLPQMSVAPQLGHLRGKSSPASSAPCTMASPSTSIAWRVCIVPLALQRSLLHICGDPRGTMQLSICASPEQSSQRKCCSAVPQCASGSGSTPTPELHRRRQWSSRCISCAESSVGRQSMLSPRVARARDAAAGQAGPAQCCFVLSRGPWFCDDLLEALGWGRPWCKACNIMMP